MKQIFKEYANAIFTVIICLSMFVLVLITMNYKDSFGIFDVTKKAFSNNKQTDYKISDEAFEKYLNEEKPKIIVISNNIKKNTNISINSIFKVTDKDNNDITNNLVIIKVTDSFNNIMENVYSYPNFYFSTTGIVNIYVRSIDENKLVTEKMYKLLVN